ncbi:MAG: DUF4167 domain-containing protein [Methylocystis sp.]|uniref:DUF4167 domain-containing protein n=1 Tax=Methylocystis sp. TaxID=1911079 RepID=UPI003D0FA8BC
MRPGQNKRIRGRSGRKGPNPLTRSYESNGPDVKIRGTAQHIAEKYLQLARDAQSSGDTIMAESLLQHAEHYFRLIAAAQQQQVNGFARPQMEAEVETAEDDDDFAALPDRFAPLSERLPAPAYQQQPQPFAQQQPHYAPPQPQPQPFEERPIGDMRAAERAERPERPQRSERPQFNRDRNAEGGDRPRNQGYDRNRERRFPPRGEAGASESGAGAALPSFITAPAARTTPSENAGAEPFVEREAAPREAAPREHESGVNYHLSSRRRRRPRPSMDDVSGGSREDEAPQVGEAPAEPDRF